MDKNNQIKRTYKLIVLTGFVLFAVLVGYKIISSNIQKNKEKAIFQEKAEAQKQADYQQQEKNRQLDTCLAQAEQKKNETILQWQNYYKNNCLNGPNVDAEIWCAEETLRLIDKAKAEAEVDKKNCYTRYK